MKTPIIKVPKKIFLIGFFLGITVLFLSSAYGQQKGNEGTYQATGNLPPVAQTLVPEGLLAKELAAALKIGQPQNEAEAESMLSSIGIEPQNGWIADYPVTPDIIGEIEGAVAAAADGNRLKMGREQARKAMESVVSQLGLNVTAGSSTRVPSGAGTVSSYIYRYTDRDGVVHFTDRYENIPPEYRDQITGSAEELRPRASLESPGDTTELPVNPAPEVVNSYYDDYGPPVVTYYAPPWPYDYMYAWVPYPFRCSGFFFSGFFILRDFHKHVFFHGRGFVVTNHVFNPRTRTFFAVDPANRRIRGRALFDRTPSPGVFSSAPAQAGARAIVETRRQRAPSLSTATGPGIRKGTSSPNQRAPRPGAASRVAPVIANQTNSAPSFTGGSSGATGNPRPPLSREMRANRVENREQSRGTVPREPTIRGVNPFKQEGTREKVFNSPAGNHQRNSLPTPPPSVRSPRVAPKEFAEPANRANGHQWSPGRQQPAGSRQLHPPAASLGSSNSHPPGRTFSPPSATPSRSTFGSALQGRISSGESRTGMGGALGRIFPGRGR